MKISIPVLDSYIEKCKSDGVKPIFESFTTENAETISHIDSKLFEAYEAYTNDSRVISILEYQAIKSYSEFLENEDELANMPEEEEEEVEDNMDNSDNAESEESDGGDDEDDDDDDDDDEEVEEAAKEIKKAEHGPEDNAKIEEMPATDDEFGIEIDIEGFGKDVDASFKEIEDEIMKMGEPEKQDDKDGEELVGEESQEVERHLTEEELLEAAEENNIIIDFLFRKPKLKKIIKKSTDLRLKGIQAETKATEMIAKKNEEMDEKIAQLKEKGASADQIKNFKTKYQENINNFKDTLDKKMTAATEAADEIEKEAEETATSDYLKRVLSRERIESRMQEAQAKMQTADETKQAELKASMQEMAADAAEKDKELAAQDGEVKQKQKELGLAPEDYDTLNDVNTNLDNIKDKEKIVNNKLGSTDDEKQKAGLQKTKDGLDTEKFKQWEIGSGVLDKVKDKDKKASMYRGLTGVGEINNNAEMNDYIETKQAEIKERGKGDKPTEAPAEKPAEAPAEKPAEAPVDKPTEAPVDKPTEAPAEKPAEAPAEKPAEAPVDKPTEAPADKPADKPADEPTQAAKDAEAAQAAKDAEEEEKKKNQPVTASVDTSIYESVAQRFRKVYGKIK